MTNDHTKDKTHLLLGRSTFDCTLLFCVVIINSTRSSPKYSAASIAKAVVAFLIVLGGLEFLHGPRGIARTSTVKSRKSNEPSEHQTLRGKNQTSSLTVHESQSNDSLHNTENDRHVDASEQSSSEEENNNDNEGQKDFVYQSNLVHSSADAESQSHQDTWERMWISQIPENTEDNNGDISVHDKERLWQNWSNQTSTSQSQLGDLFSAFSRPEYSVSLYNESAYDELILDLVQSHENGQNFTIVASGGSTTCGAAKNIPVTRQEERYYSQFAGYLNTLLSEGGNMDTRQTVQWIGQGHGARTGLHTAIFFDSFIPRDSDLLLWEFSINDAVDWFGDPELLRKSVRNDLIVWLEEVRRMKRPAKVMLIYYWDTPYHHDVNTTEIVGQAFEAHAAIAREFDFVVGHVNVGSFIDEAKFPGCSIWETCPLLADKQHASKLGHTLTAYLLLNLMNPTKRFLLSPETEENAMRENRYEWNCVPETDAKQLVKQAVTDPKLGWKSSIGEWTLDLPAYDQTTPKRLVAGPGLGNIELVDKADPLRQDRKRCTAVKYCGEETSFSVIAPQEPMKNVHVVLLVFKKQKTVLDTEDINVFLNGSNVTTSGQLVPMRTDKDPSILRTWPCHLSGGWSSFADTYWYIFENPVALVESMKLCTPIIVRIQPKIQSVAFW